MIFEIRYNAKKLRVCMVLYMYVSVVFKGKMMINDHVIGI